MTGGVASSIGAACIPRLSPLTRTPWSNEVEADARSIAAESRRPSSESVLDAGSGIHEGVARSSDPIAQLHAYLLER